MTAASGAPAAGLDELARRLAASARTTVVTGAGVSAASGVPTFRGPGGLWHGHPAQDLATPGAFARDPGLVWRWYDWRRQVVALCRPNRAHEVLAGWSRRWPGFTLVTQNVDGLHERAGARGVLRFHGSLWELRCSVGCAHSPPSWTDDTPALDPLPPVCPWCGGLARPGVVWFGEGIPPDVLAASLEAARCEVFVVAGTSSVVHPAAALLEVARAAGAFTAEINLEPTPVTGRVDLALPGAAEEVLDALDARLP